MGQILEIIEKYSGGKCFYSDRYTLDHFAPPEYQDEDEQFKTTKVRSIFGQVQCYQALLLAGAFDKNKKEFVWHVAVPNKAKSIGRRKKPAADVQRTSKSRLDCHLLQFGCLLSKNLTDLLL